MKCHICEETFENYRKLSKHVRDKHEPITVKEYYDTYIKSECDGICTECGKPTKWLSISSGYRKTCSHKCSCIKKRRELKSSPEKYNRFVEKVRLNQTNIWDKRTQNEKQKISCKSSKTLKYNNSKLSKDQLSLKYGWLNNLDSEDKKEKIIEIIDKSLKKWWKEATPEQIETVIKKRMETKYGKNIAISPNKRSAYKKYECSVRSKTESTYRKHCEEIDPENKRGKNYHLDHKVSIFTGFINSLPPSIIASKYNLEIIEAKDNMIKNRGCSMEIQELVKLWESENQELTKEEE
jgi:hypothetical protein